ncbi:hypothetical protein GW17_00040486 [Ensete ventricosum]|nr:hypothetical protein GW17_00040486 [Ensete ventricosum]
MRRLRGRWRARKRATKHRTEERELRSRGSTMTTAPGNAAATRALVSSAAFRLLAGSTSLAPRIARTRAVSAPIPDGSLTGDDRCDGAEVRGRCRDLLACGSGAKPAGTGGTNQSCEISLLDHCSIHVVVRTIIDKPQRSSLI